MAPKFPGTVERRPLDNAVQRAQTAAVLSPRNRARQDILAAPVRLLNTVPEAKAIPATRATSQPTAAERPGGNEGKLGIGIDWLKISSLSSFRRI